MQLDLSISKPVDFNEFSISAGLLLGGSLNRRVRRVLLRTSTLRARHVPKRAR
jgi:hypothetical protein